MARRSAPVVLGIIPARGGSKRLPGKNIKPLAGKPLIAWTISAARRSRRLSRAVVSTDDPRIARAARRCGGDVPFMRPAALAKDSSTSAEAAQHAVSWFEAAEGRPVDWVVLLQPTSPLVTAQDIDAAIALAVDSGADSAQTVTEDHLHPWHRYLMNGTRLSPMMARPKKAPSVYRPNGMVYVVRRDVLMKDGKFQGRDHRGLVCPFEASIDIDDEWDFELAGRLLKRRGAARAR
jgi:CMP-N-acetylneuraminic acid synthetase